MALAEYRRTEAAGRGAYEWVDRNAGTVRIPIDRAKALLVERGLPTRPGAGPASPVTASATPAPASAPVAATPAAPAGH
jgi:hypothetical protein